MYVYKKKDKEKKNPIEYTEAIQFKTLYKKADKSRKILEELRSSLMFHGEDELTKRSLYKAIDCIKSFQDNLKLKECYEVE